VSAVSEISVDQIRKQVNHICQSKELKTKLQLCRLLNYLVEETLAGRSEQLKGYNIGVEVFNKDNDFNTEQDPIVRIHAGRLRRMLKIYYLDSGVSDPVIINIPKGKYVPIFISNAGIAEVDKKKSEPKSQSENIISPTVVILPFKNLSNDRSKDFFALGFSEEISVELTKFEDIKVFDNLSFEGNLTDSDKSQLLKNRNIRFIIEGSVLFGNHQVKILVKLTDLLDDEQVWAEKFTSNASAKGLNAVQENIARDVASIIGSEFGIIMHRLSQEANHSRTQITDTYNAILKFHYFEALQTSEAFLQAFDALHVALKKEPDSGIVTALLASLHINQYLLDIGDAQEAYNKMVELCEKAVNLEPNSFTVSVVKVCKHFACDEKNRFFSEAENCLKRNPNNSFRLGILGQYLALWGDWERGKNILDKIINSNIRYPLFLHGPTMLYFYRKKEYDQALIEATNYDVPALFWGALLRVAVLGQLNNTEEAAKHISDLLKLKPGFEQKAEYLISRCVKEDSLINHILEGLRLAGLKL